MSGVFRDAKIHGTFNGKVESFSHDTDNSSKDQKCLKAPAALNYCILL